MRGKIRYQKELQNTYMIAEEGDRELLESYCGQTILRGKIRGLADCEIHLMDGRREIWYDISFLQSLEQAFAVKEMACHDLKNLLLQIIRTVTEMERYLLDGGQVCFEPEYIYWNMETEQAVFLFDFTEEKTESGLARLGEFILERVCHEEESAVDLAYFFYECSVKDSFSVKEVEQYLEGQAMRTEAKEDASRVPEPQTGEQTEEEEIENEFREMMRQKEEKADHCREKQGKNGVGFVFACFGKEKVGKCAEAGAACIITALLSGGGFLAFQKYFLLEEKEQLLWTGISVLLFLSGILLALYGLRAKKKGVKADRKTEKKAAGMTEKYGTEETGFWDEDYYAISETEFRQQAGDGLSKQGRGDLEDDKKTIYIGKALLNREYSLNEIRKGTEKEHPIASYPFLIGKDKERVNLYIKEHSVSRIHARILEENGDIYIEDLHSTNGTSLNDLPLQPHEKVRIKRGDIVLFGGAEFVFR